MKNQNIKPNEKERIALSLFYNRFYDLYEELSHNDFFNNTSSYRFYKIREIFSVYKELLGYEPIQYHIKLIKKTRPPLEGIIVNDLFSFVRNLLLHFPIFENWDDVYISKDLATWNKVGTIHKFLKESSKIKIDDKGIDLRLLTMIFLFLYFANANELENTLEKKEIQKEKNIAQ